MDDADDDIEPVFTEENRKLFFFASAILVLVWILIMKGTISYSV